jgi:hypothetical protein
MRHGRKSERQRFDGYKIHAAAATEAPLLTAIEISPGCDYDGQLAAALIDQQPPELRPRRLLGDAAYGDSKTREQLEAREVDVLAPVPEPPPPAGRIGKRDFTIDLAAGTVICPAGQVTPISERPQRSGVRIAQFRRSSCRPCPLAARCVGADGRRQITIARREDLLAAGREALKDPPTRERLRRTRPLIERLLGLLAHRYQARKSRYRGKRKASFQALWTAVLVNLHPIEAALATTAR